ncbi:acyl carrier protein [Streptomyces sp. NPDC060053]|uniref:acyl carrier protein n=1 Tax=Streptomyces sp. NPDC060053 TaxID=3347047 RepID=UPI00368562D8
MPGDASKALARVLKEVLQPVFPVTLEDADRKLFELGADSLTLVHLLVRTEMVFDIEIDVEEIGGELTASKLAELVEKHLGEKHPERASEGRQRSERTGDDV